MTTSSGKSKILVVESRASSSKRIEDLLTAAGHQVRLCSDSKAAIGHALAFKPDVVLASDRMPVINGTELARLFKSLEHLAVIPFILLTDEPAALAGRSDVGARRADDLLYRSTLTRDLLPIVTRWLGAPTLKFAPQVDPYPPSLGQVRGLIHTTNMVEAFYCLINSRVSGYLYCRLERKQIHVGVQSGRVVDVRTNYDREDALARFLVEIRRISSEDAKRGRTVFPSPGTSRQHIYVDMGLLSEDELNDVLRRYKAKKLLTIFQKPWDGGFFEFRPRTLLAEDPPAASLKLCDFLKFGLKRQVAVRWAYRDLEVEAQELMHTLHSTKRFDHVTKLLELDPASVEMLSQLEGRTLKELRHDPIYDAMDAVHLVFLMLVTRAMWLGPRDEKRKDGRGVFIPKTATAPLPLEAQTTADAQYLEMLQNGQKSFHDGQFAQASGFLRRAMDLNSRSSEAMAMMAWIVFNASDRFSLPAIQEAKDLLKEALSLNDKNDRAHYYLGLIFKAEHKYSLAAMHFRTAFALNPLNEDAEEQIRLSLARLYPDDEKSGSVHTLVGAAGKDEGDGEPAE